MHRRRHSETAVTCLSPTADILDGELAAHSQLASFSRMGQMDTASTECSEKSADCATAASVARTFDAASQVPLGKQNEGNLKDYGSSFKKTEEQRHSK